MTSVFIYPPYDEFQIFKFEAFDGFQYDLWHADTIISNIYNTHVSLDLKIANIFRSMDVSVDQTTSFKWTHTTTELLSTLCFNNFGLSKTSMHSTSPHRHDIIKDFLNSDLLLVRLLQANSPEVAWGASSMPFAVISKNYHGTVLSLKTPKRATGWSWWWPTPSKKTEKLLWQTKLSGLLNFSSRFD